ncbi:MAG TPA: hypothetical protein PKX05_05310 [bacterium]|nr:hypothetical protein [bacterium]
MKYKVFIILSGMICGMLMGADFSIEPSIFSPKESPGIKDTIDINGYMEQTLPININIYSQGHPDIIQRTIPYSQINYSYGDIFNRAYSGGPVQLIGISDAIAICGTNRICVSSFNNKEIVILNCMPFMGTQPL